jgi:H+/gluconate symporter-like permease
MTLALVPMLVPIIILERGNISIIRIIKGNERKALTTRVSSLKTIGLGLIPVLGSEIQSKMPRGKPKSKEKKVEENTIARVCNVAFPTSVNIALNEVIVFLLLYFQFVRLRF